MAEDREEIIDLGNEPIDLPQVSRERFAQRLALRLVSYFGWTLLGLVLLGVGLMVAGTILDRTGMPSTSKSLIDQYLGILQAVGTFVASIFGSILGFILGHYFRKEGTG